MGEDDELGAVAGTDVDHGVVHVCLDGGEAEHELRGDLVVGHAGGRVVDGTRRGGGGEEVLIRLLVAMGDSSASPRWTVRMAWSSSSASALLPRKPLAPARSASKTYSSISKVVRIRTFTPAAEGRTVLMSSHVLSEVEQTVDRVVIVAGGTLRYAGPLAELTGAKGETLEAAFLRLTSTTTSDSATGVQAAPARG